MNTKKLHTPLVAILGLVLVLVSMRGNPAPATVHAAAYSSHLLQEGWTDLFQISDQPGTYWNSPRISGDGKWVVFKEGFNTYLARSDGSDLREIDLLSYNSFPDISADGSKVVAVRSCAISIHEGGATRSLTPCVSGNGGSRCLCADRYVAAISGNGRWLFYISDDPWPCKYVDDAWQCTGNLDGSREVWRLDATTGDAVQVTDFNTGEDTGAFWVSSDFTGSKIAFTSGTDDEVYLYSVNGDGSNLRKLVQVRPGPSSFLHRNLAFISGSGEWIVFNGKDANGHSEVDIIKSDGSEQRVIRAGYGCDHGPHGADCSISYNGSIITVGTLFDTTEVLDNQGNLLETIPGEEAALSYDGMQMVFLSDRAALGLGSETDEQVFTMKRGVTKEAPITATIGSRMYYTLTLHHGDSSTLSADLTDSMPDNVTYVPDSVWASAGAAGYNAAQQQVAWNGDVAVGETVTVTFAVTPTCVAPPPPMRAENWATVNLGGKTYHPMAVTTIVLPEKNLTALADSPAVGVKDVRIESSGVGPLLRWHDQASSLTCGAGTDDDVAYKVYLRKQEGSWQEVGTYPNCSRQVQLSKNDLSCQNNGDPASYTWKVVTYDPMYPCREPVENPFNFSTASCRPELDVKPQLTLSPGYFLDNRPVDNVIKVEVDWNGPAYETPDTSPPYGDVYFDLNGKQSQESGQQWGAEHAYDMGRDFESSLSCANNTLQIWAINADGVEAEKGVIQPTVFPFPGWVDWLENLHLGEFNTEKKEPLVEYTYAFKYPEDPFEANWTPPGWIPYLGGHELGILETQAEANAVGKSDGSGLAGVSGQTGLGLGAVDVAGTLSGQGNAQFTCGESLDFTGAELNFGIHATIEQEAGLADVIPAARAAEKWPVVGRAVCWVNSIATLKATLTPGVDIATEFEERNDQLEFVHGEGTGSIDARVTLAAEVCEDISASAYGGGTPYITIQVPQDPGYLKEVGIDMYYGATFQAWQFEREYERKINCHYPGGCSEVESSGMMAMADGADWRLIPRDYAARPVLHASIALQATGVTTETVLVSPAYARPEPALAVRADGCRLLAYIHDDTTKPHGRGAEIRALTWDGSNWSSTAVTDDQQPDFAPAVAFEDGGDNGLVVWERSMLPAAITPTLDITFAQSLEIAYAVYAPTLGTWSAPVTLTGDSLMDYAPNLSSGEDGTVLALWQTTDGNDILGTAGHPLTYTYAIWDGSSWGTPAVAFSGLQDVVGTAFAAYSSTQAALVYAVDADGLLTTTADSELYYSSFDGAWSSPTRLTNDVISDT
ncbi:MAG: hypothetical protein J7M17_02150, partial [Anaerolineae bacterium]|nr:hypothetical protein [Anaerolineae bacterium]